MAPETSPSQSATRWTSRSIASRFQHGFFYALIRLAGRWPAYAFLHLVTAWYTLLRPSIRRRTYHYLRRRFPEARGAALLLHSYRLATAFGKSLVDRAVVGILGPERLAIDFPQAATLQGLLDEGKGVVLMTAHVGGWQAAMPGVDFLQAPVNMLLQRAQDDVDRHWYEHAGRERPFRTIDPAGYLGGSLEMLAALKRGELLCVMGDRVLGSERNVLPVPFLGGEALFPVSAYRIAAAADAPIAALFARKTGPARYELLLPAVIRVPDGLGRAPEAYRPYVAAFVAALEAFAQDNPYQFYNFHDMWM
jgi:predicted LPLAT superfamily acyltransferase